MPTYIGAGTYSHTSQAESHVSFGVGSTQYVYTVVPSGLASFLASHTIGSAEAGGDVIISREVSRGGSAFAKVTLNCVRRPSLSPIIANQMALRTATKSAEVDNQALYLILTGGVPPESGDTFPIYATMSVSYFSPETQYDYWRIGRPSGAQYGNVASSQQPTIIRQRIDVSAGAASKTYGAIAPAAISSALSLAVVTQLISHDARQMNGTNYYECRDVVARVYAGD